MKIRGDRLTKARNNKGLTQQELADRVGVSQQGIGKLERQKSAETTKINEIARALGVSLNWLSGEDDGMGQMPVRNDSAETVPIEVIPTYAGMGGGGDGEGEPDYVHFQSSLIRHSLKGKPIDFVIVEAVGDSMMPDFHTGDQLLIDRRYKTISQPGAFCLYDGNGVVIKLLENIPNSNPPMIRVFSANQRYKDHEALLEEINIIGRVVWFGRRV